MGALVLAGGGIAGIAWEVGVLFGIEMSGPAPDRVRSSIGDRGFLADVFVELFEGTEAQATIVDEPAADFHASVEGWLARVLTAALIELANR